MGNYCFFTSSFLKKDLTDKMRKILKASVETFVMAACKATVGAEVIRITHTKSLQ